MKLAVRFRTILSTFMVIAALVPVLLLALTYYGEGAAAEVRARAQAGNALTFAAQLIEHELDRSEAQFAALMQEASDSGPISRSALVRLLEAPGAESTFRALHLVDSEGVTQLYHAVGEGHPVLWNLSRAPEAGRPLLLAMPDALHPELPALAYAGALPGAPGRVLVAELRPEPLRAILQEYAAAIGLHPRVVATGAEPPAAESDGRAVTPVPAAGSLLEVRAESLPSDMWGMSWQRVWASLAIGGLSVAAAWAMARTLAWHLDRPVTALLAAAERLAHGHRGDQIAPARGLLPVELRTLLERFNHFSARLGTTHDSLVETNQSLEQRVAERTRELARRNVDLGYSRATLYAVMESMTDGIVLITPDHRIRYVSRHTEELLRLTEAFYPGRPAEELYAAVANACEAPEETRKRLEPLAEGSPGEVVLTVCSGGRSDRYLRWRTFPIRNATGADLGLGHILTDITQEREIDRVKSELISIVSHELRTPLTAIRASASSLLRPGVEWDDETRGDFLQTIQEESRHLQELIENLLDMSKIEAGVLKLDLHPTDVGELVQGAVNRARAAYPDWSLKLAVPPGLPPVMADPRRLQQVLLNLVDNAVKYAAQSREVLIGAHRKPAEIWLSVYDEGIGIPPEHLELIFQRFHRVDSRMTRDTGGSGLGLAISRGLVEAHGGRIWATSEPGRGSTFYIALPIAPEEGETDEA